MAMKKISNAVDITRTVMIARTLQKMILNGCDLATLAYLYPTSLTHKIDFNFEDDTSLSRGKIYWSRLLNGKRGLQDKGLIERLKSDYQCLEEMLNYVLWSILSLPYANQQQIGQLILRLRPFLERVFFDLSEDQTDIWIRKVYWTPKYYDIVESVHALAFRLILMRKNQLSSTPPARYSSSKEAFLHLLRLTTFRPFSFCPDRLLRLFYYFLCVNGDRVEFKADNAPNWSTDNADDIFAYLFKIYSPNLSKRPQYLLRLNEYLSCNQETISNARKSVWGKLAPGFKMYDGEILYLADCESALWLEGHIEKPQIFQHNTDRLRKLKIRLEGFTKTLVR